MQDPLLLLSPFAHLRVLKAENAKVQILLPRLGNQQEWKAEELDAKLPRILRIHDLPFRTRGKRIEI